jgi:hypothetical protein
MENRTAGSDNNRANEGNQSSRHRHSTGTGSSIRHPAEQTTGEQNPSDAHEYYPEFDESGKGVNPKKKIRRN